MKPRISLIGIGDDGWHGLPVKTQQIIAQSRHVFGGKRHIDALPALENVALHTWRSPLIASLPDIADASPPVAVLASGDPMWFGIGKLLHQHFPAHNIATLPFVSSFALCCACLGWQMENVTTLSLHNQPTSTLLRYLKKKQKLLLLTRNASSLPEIVTLLSSIGAGETTLHVLEHLGGEKEQITTLTPKQYLQSPTTVSDLYCVAIETPSCWKYALPLFGLPDDAFHHDGTITKAPIRAMTIADLDPHNNHSLWDIGAGAGSVAIEWVRLGGSAYAIENNASRLELITMNAEKFGMPDLHIIHGSAPEACHDLPSPDAIFIGGGLAKNNLLFPFCYERLNKGGCLVANAVTLECEAEILRCQRLYGGKLTRIALSHVDSIGVLHGWRPSIPLIHYVLEKPHG